MPTMGGWKTWTGFVCVVAGAALKFFGLAEQAEILQNAQEVLIEGGFAGMLVGVAHKLEKAGLLKRALALLILPSFLLLGGCATQIGKARWPSCNKGYPETHQLANAADSIGVCLKDVGTDIILVSALSINLDRDIAKLGVIYGRQVVEFLKDAGHLFSGQAFKDYLFEEIVFYPGLSEILEINTPLLNGLPSATVLDPDSIKTLLNFFENRFIPKMEAYSRR